MYESVLDNSIIYIHVQYNKIKLSKVKYRATLELFTYFTHLLFVSVCPSDTIIYEIKYSKVLLYKKIIYKIIDIYVYKI